jgi:hypothetical protein
MIICGIVVTLGSLASLMRYTDKEWNLNNVLTVSLIHRVSAYTVIVAAQVNCCIGIYRLYGAVPITALIIVVTSYLAYLGVAGLYEFSTKP